MDDETMYPVCSDRNVVSAFQCFLGPDSRGLDRFLGDERMHWAGDALYIVRAQGRWALAGAAHKLRSAAQALSQAVADFNPVLTWWWIAASSAFSALSFSLVSSTEACARFLLYQGYVALKEFCRVWLPRRCTSANEAAAVIGRWASHYRLPLIVRSRRVGGLPV
jgi:hypothetical protein